MQLLAALLLQEIEEVHPTRADGDPNSKFSTAEKTSASMGVSVCQKSATSICCLPDIPQNTSQSSIPEFASDNIETLCLSQELCIFVRFPTICENGFAAGVICISKTVYTTVSLEVDKTRRPERWRIIANWFDMLPAEQPQH